MLRGVLYENVRENLFIHPLLSKKGKIQTLQK